MEIRYSRIDRTRRLLPALLIVSLAVIAVRPSAESQEVTAGQRRFVELMETVAKGWNSGDARLAADCFTRDAIYSEPPDKQLFHGREALFEFFGGDDGRDRPMHMVWHHLTYNSDTGIGMGEFSFWIEDSDPSHGVIVVRLRDGLITNWREYYYESELPWEEFVAANPF